MTTAVDSSVLIDVFAADPQFAASSLAALKAARQMGFLIACPTVWAEVAAIFAQPGAMNAAMAAAGIAFSPFDVSSAKWSAYRRAGGARQRLVGDFLDGAHAQCFGGRLLSRDRGFYRRYFQQLDLL